MTGLSVEGLVVQYGPVRAVNGISLQVDLGQIVALFGANGAGKTSTLNAISGLKRPAAGTICYRTVDVTSWSAHKIARLGLVHVPEGRRIIGPLTVEENLLLGAYTRARRSISGGLETVYEMFPILANRRRGRAGLLSGGEQQMLAFGRGLMAEPSIMLIDEPSMGLAPLIIGTVANAIRQIRDRGIGVLIVEQNVSVALALADRAHILALGDIVLEGTPKELKGNRVVVEAYMGASSG